MSTTNAVLLVVIWGGAVVAAATGHGMGATFLALAGLGGLLGALYARRPGSRDVTRVNAIEYRDERDRRIAQAGFSAVGAAALVVSVVTFVVTTVVAQPYAWLAALHVLVLCTVWGVANSVAARRT